jgi:hypothetical protein
MRHTKCPIRKRLLLKITHYSYHLFLFILLVFTLRGLFLLYLLIFSKNFEIHFHTRLNLGSKPAMWIDGGIHAREWISPATVTFMIRQLVEVKDPEEADLLDNLDWYILPQVNPDGYEHTRTSDRLWRKTR